MSCPGKEHGANKPPPTRRNRDRSKGDATCPNTSQNPSCWHPSWLNKACTTRKDSESKWLTKDNLEPNPITIKYMWQFSWFPYPTALCPGELFLIKSLALSPHVSPQTIHFWPVRQEPFGALEGAPLPATRLQPGRGSLPDLAGTLISDFQRPELWKKKNSLVHKPHSLWHFVIAAWTKTHSL